MLDLTIVQRVLRLARRAFDLPTLSYRLRSFSAWAEQGSSVFLLGRDLRFCLLQVVAVVQKAIVRIFNSDPNPSVRIASVPRRSGGCIRRRGSTSISTCMMSVLLDRFEHVESCTILMLQVSGLAGRVVWRRRGLAARMDVASHVTWPRL